MPPAAHGAHQTELLRRLIYTSSFSIMMTSTKSLRSTRYAHINHYILALGHPYNLAPPHKSIDHTLQRRCCDPASCSVTISCSHAPPIRHVLTRSLARFPACSSGPGCRLVRAVVALLPSTAVPNFGIIPSNRL
jgi:hypothetical protein